MHTNVNRRMKSKTPVIWSLILGLLLAAALACNLSAEQQPILPARPTNTPPPTLGYATLSPAQLPAQETAIPAAQLNMINLLNRVEGDRLIIHVDTLQRFGTRHVLSSQSDPTKGIGAAQNYILSQFNQISQQTQGGLFVYPQPFEFSFNDVDTYGTNIIAVLTGTEVGSGVIVVGAHYDSISIPFTDGSVTAPGANDNGSGVAALLELARVLAQRPHRQTIMFVAFAAEEIGRRGSQFFVQTLRAQTPPIPVVAMLNMDIIGSATGPNGAVNDTQIRLYADGGLNGTSQALARAINLYDYLYVPEMETLILDAPDRQGRYSDHLSFSDAGMPAVRFVELLEDTARQHNDADVVDDIQVIYITRATQTVLAAITAMADGLRPPSNISVRDLGGGLRRLLWDPVQGASGYLVALRAPGALNYQFFEITGNTVDWDGFTAARFTALAIASRDADGLYGMLSPEFYLP